MMNIDRFLQKAEGLAEAEKRKAIIAELRTVDDARFQIAVNVLEAESKRMEEMEKTAWDKMAGGLLYLKKQDEQHVQQGA